MKRDIIIIEDKAVSVTGNDVWMTATEIAGLFQLLDQIRCLAFVSFNVLCITVYDDIGNDQQQKNKSHQAAYLHK